MLWLACAPPASDPQDSLEPPSITQLALRCERDTASWALELETAGWVSGATWWIAPEDLPIESHTLRSNSAASDGSWEALSLGLDQVADPRLQVDNSSTSALCPQTQTAMRLAIFDPTDGETSACVLWGGTLDWTSQGLTEPCEIRDLSW